MNVGETSEITIEANQPWNDTFVDVVQNGVYRITAAGEWCDLFIRTDANGYDSVLSQRLFESRRRIASAKWFALIGSLGRDDSTAFVIGDDIVWTAPATGRLFAFANDVPGFYFNNFGRISVKIDRMR